MHALHGNTPRGAGRGRGTVLGNRGGRRGAQGSHVARKRKLKKMTKAGARESFYLMAANVCGIHMEKGGETMEVIGDVTTAGERDTGYDASEKLDELIRLVHEGNARLAVWADTHSDARLVTDVPC